VDNHSFLQVVEGMFEDCDSHEIQLFVGVARHLWLRRNALIHEGIFVSPAVLMKQAIEAAEDYRKANEVVPTSGQMERIRGWVVPPVGWVVVHWDAAIDASRGRLGSGVFLKDREGSFLAAKSSTHKGFGTLATAEAYAALEAIQLSWDLGYEHIQFLGDAKVIINAENSEELDWSSVGHLI
jgi:hypothetical protein